MTIQEMYTMIALVLMMEVIKKPSYKSYWSSDPMLFTPIFSRAMALNRFIDILGNLHFMDILTNNLLKPGKDSVRRIRPVLDHIRRVFKASFNPSSKLCIDKSLVLWHGKAWF